MAAAGALAGPFVGSICATKQPAALEANQQTHRTLVSRPSISPKAGHLLPRSEQINRLKSLEFDVLVVGGGATGAGAALDAATRGLKTAMIERGDFGNETSARSTKLIWAGIRYIATGFSSLLRLRNITRPVEAIKDFWAEFQMVSHAHKERRYVRKRPHALIIWFESLRYNKP